MILPISILLVPYGLLLIVFIIGGALNTYHVLRYSIRGSQTPLLITVFLLGSGILLICSLLALGQTDWSQPIPLEQWTRLSVPVIPSL